MNLFYSWKIVAVIMLFMLLGSMSRATGLHSSFFQNDGPAKYTPKDLYKVADAIPTNEAPIVGANHPYHTMGKKYYPLQNNKPYTVIGNASWYGKQFNGRKTASGERYNMFAMTAAHRTLPIPSYARVTNLANNKSIIVRVNDRGPFSKTRVMDMSYAAAFKLGFVKAGRAKVKIERVFSNSEPSDIFAHNKSNQSLTNVMYSKGLFTNNFLLPIVKFSGNSNLSVLQNM